MGKGSNARPYSVPRDQYEANRERIMPTVPKHCPGCGYLPSWCVCTEDGPGQEEDKHDDAWVQRMTMLGMADCMDMVRQELIEAGIIDRTVAPMFIANAVCKHIAAIRADYDEAIVSVSQLQAALDEARIKVGEGE